MTVDKRKGTLTIDTSRKLSVTPKVKVVIGSQDFISDTFSIEIFACADVVSFPALKEKYSFQVGSEAAGVEMKAEASEPACATFTGYGMDGETKGSVIDPTTGIMTVDTSAEITASTRKIFVVVGGETVYSPEFSFEVFSCYPHVKFAEEIMIQIGDTASNRDPKRTSTRNECQSTDIA